MISLSNFKYYAGGILFLAYSVGIWHVSAHLEDYSNLQEKAELQQKFIETNASNDKLRGEITKILQDNLKTNAENAKTFSKELIDEMAKDPRYKSCITTDGVRDALQRKLDSQPK